MTASASFTKSIKTAKLAAAARTRKADKQGREMASSIKSPSIQYPRGKLFDNSRTRTSKPHVALHGRDYSI